MQDLIQMSDQLAYQFFQAKMYKQAYYQSEITLSMDTLNKGARFNTAKCAYYANEYNKAIEHINVCLMLDPNSEDAKRELALYLPWIGETDRAFEIIQELPQDDRTMFNRGWYALKEGKFLEGMQYLNHGRRINCWGTNGIQMPTPEWFGESANGKKIFVINEGGYGDEIIFARFLQYIKRLGAEVYVKCSKEMESIFKRMDYVDFVTTNNMYPTHDYWVPSMALPVKLGSTTVSGEPYITVDPEYVQKWRDKLELEDFNIGIRWEGGQLFEHDQRRTLPINKLVEAIGSYGKLFSLQKDEIDTPVSININEIESFDDTLAIISLMDIVVTSCTITAHLSGAIGKRTIVIVPIVPYFTWSGPFTWYDSVEILRQVDPLNWDEPIKTLEKIMYE
jgi:tetratricopeptide (TPR) repeat protein